MIFFVAIWAVALNWLAYQKGFFKLPKRASSSIPIVSTGQLFGLFGLYVGLMVLFAPFLARFILLSLHKANPDIRELPISFITGFQFFLMLIIFVVLAGTLYKLNRGAFAKIWKNRTPPSNPVLLDFAIGIFAWLLSFPIVSVISEIVDKILQSIFGLEYYEQTAVKFVKAAMSSPISLTFAILSVLVLAPLMEELLFRGLLQTYCKKRLGAKPAILISSLCFALFHFSSSQGLGNISLILSLFILGGFLGLIYERQGSLWASVGLHMTFNAVSALRIIILPELL